MEIGLTREKINLMPEAAAVDAKKHAGSSYHHRRRNHL